MNTATFRTLAETMGMEQAWIADQLGVAVRTVARWHSPSYGQVPEFASVWVIGWWERFQGLLGQVVDQFAENVEEYGDPAVTVVSRFATEEAYAASGPEHGLAWSMHQAYVGLLVAALEFEGVTALVEWKE